MAVTLQCFHFAERQNHARDVVKSYDFSTIDGIVVSSGDGLIFEVRPEVA